MTPPTIPAPSEQFEKLRTDVPMTLKELNKAARDIERNYNLLVEELESLELKLEKKA